LIILITLGPHPHETKKKICKWRFSMFSLRTEENRYKKVSVINTEHTSYKFREGVGSHNIRTSPWADRNSSTPWLDCWYITK
jgi:hypothetical protein